MDELDDHLTAHNLQQCLHCEDVFPVVMMDSHILSKHGYTTCPFCQTPWQDLLRHIFESHHPSINPSQTPDPLTDPSGSRQDRPLPHQEDKAVYVKCAICDKSVRKSYETEHIRKQHPNRQIDNAIVECPECKESVRKVYLPQHMFKRHPGYKKSYPAARKEYKEPRIYCDGCKRYHSRSNVSRCSKCPRSIVHYRLMVSQNIVQLNKRTICVKQKMPLSS